MIVTYFLISRKYFSAIHSSSFSMWNPTFVANYTKSPHK
jgi:hypothetical protein